MVWIQWAFVSMAHSPQAWRNAHPLRKKAHLLAASIDTESPRYPYPSDWVALSLFLVVKAYTPTPGFVHRYRCPFPLGVSPLATTCEPGWWEHGACVGALPSAYSPEIEIGSRSSSSGVRFIL